MVVKWIGSFAITAFLLALGALALAWLGATLGGVQTGAALYISIIAAGGLLGGFVNGYMAPPSGRLTLARMAFRDPPSVELGIVGDMLVGVTAAFGVFFLLVGVFDFTGNGPTLDRLLKLFGLSIAAGIAGRLVLARLPSEIERRLGDTEQRLVDADFQMNLWRGQDAADQGLMGQAEEFLAKAAEAKPDDPELQVAYAYLRARQGNLRDAIALCTRAIAQDARNERAFYNRACYRARDGQPLPEVLKDLWAAIELNGDNRELARTDPDFEAYRAVEEFRRLVGE